jgi:site-specific recombinase XerD
VKELLGHQSIQTTERYTHTRDETLKNAVKRMEEKIINPQKSNHDCMRK